MTAKSSRMFFSSPASTAASQADFPAGSAYKGSKGKSQPGPRNLPARQTHSLRQTMFAIFSHARKPCRRHKADFA